MQLLWNLSFSMHRSLQNHLSICQDRPPELEHTPVLIFPFKEYRHERTTKAVVLSMWKALTPKSSRRS